VNSREPQPEPAALVRLAAGFYAVVFGLALGLGWWAGRPLLYRDAAAQRAGIAWLPDLAAGLAVAALVIALSAVLVERTGWGRALAAELSALLGPLATRHCVALAAVSGLAEEALFRGALQPWLGLIPASLIFGLVHFVPRRDLAPWCGFAVLAGLLLGGLYEWTGNLVAPVVAHAAINAVNLRLLARRAERGR
jgi:membrane protease YdiL (CAAX protease family)